MEVTFLKSAWNSKYTWEMHRSRDVHKALMRAKWVMNFAHHFLASLQLGISIRCVAWPLKMSWKCSGSAVCLQFPLLSFHSDSGYALQELAISWVFYERKQATLDKSQARESEIVLTEEYQTSRQDVLLPLLWNKCTLKINSLWDASELVSSRTLQPAAPRNQH